MAKDLHLTEEQRKGLFADLKRTYMERRVLGYIFKDIEEAMQEKQVWIEEKGGEQYSAIRYDDLKEILSKAQSSRKANR